ncbi:MAG TPA: penicillin-binding protein [Flavobacteriales bacterium]|nr:penicillin-binding protein [Flavobacteriales bacterium]HRE74887.1 transglycosylase domain-containing protein [Flavobacteriales bacterium]HRE96162.1 transglycosylase domain-containing protein [Flavobacteriales bacterium]HRJ37503.1 transglycosylase domain-containing protein [Flavobacteriales bacterium]
MAKENSEKKSVDSGLGKRGKRMVLAIWWMIALGPIVSVWLVMFFVSMGNLPSFDELENPSSNEATMIISGDGQILGKYFKENRTNVKYNQISRFVIDCLVATEDERYYDHSGIDFKALPRVFSGAITGNTNRGGGSTITQQLAKMLFHDKAKSTLERVKQKLQEWVIAVRLERAYTKEEIITMYLNKFDFVNNAVGIHSAARVYFNTTPDSLKIHEAALLVGMCQNPAMYNPKRFPERAMKRREIVLYQLMRSSENPLVKTKITREQYDSLRVLPIELDFQSTDHVEGPAPYFREELRKELTALFEKKDENGNFVYHKKDGSPYNIYNDGLRIYTTLDSRMQRYAEWAVAEHLGKELQIDFDKDNKRWKNPPFSNDITKEKGDSLILASVHRSKRYRILSGKLCGNCERTKDMAKKGDFHICGFCGDSLAYRTENEIDKIFNTPTKMRVFTWRKPGNEFDTLMSPRDSIIYYKRFLQVGMVSMDPHTGFIKAWVGGPNFKHFQFDHVQVGKRQVGSTFKPFVYAAAFRDRVLSPCSTAPDIEHCIEVPLNARTNKLWCPRNAGVKYTGEQIPLFWALAASMNNITAFIMQKEKPALVIKLVEDLGIPKGYLDPVPAICLGVCDLSVLQIVAAQSAFANKGVYIKPMMYTRIEDRQGNVILDVQPETNEAMDEHTAYAMLEIMKGATSGAINPFTGKVAGTALRMRSGKPYGGIKTAVAGKTGTTQNNSDGWFIGLTPDLVTGVWVGCEDRSVRFSRTDLGQGANTAMPVWGYYMKKVYADKQLKISTSDFERPDDFPEQFLNCREGKGMASIWNEINFLEVETDQYEPESNGGSIEDDNKEFE